VTVVDLWVNALTGKAAAAFLGQAGNEGIPDLLGGDLSASSTLQHLLVTMDACDVDVGVIAAGIASEETGPLLHDVAAHPDRLRVALTVDRPDRPVQQVTRLRALAADPAVALVRITPLVHQYPLNDKLYYPVYATCAELGLPVSINVGIPGPRVRSACQHPELLEDVLIDFKGLTVIGAHMGHPYEGLLMQYMLKWPDLYLSNSAYLAKYMDPALVSFMDSKRGKGRVLYASDHPFLPMDRAVAAARDLPLSDAAAQTFLGGTAARLLHLG
jgi:predicted TIM-barrel fold metal-dependent hydrolase